MSSQHERFLARLAGSRAAVDAVAAWLRGQGRVVDVPETQFAPTAEQAQRFVDSGDIILKPSGERIEVKQIKPRFSCRADWPFKECFISNEAAVLRAGENVAAYVTVSSCLKFAAIVSPKRSKAQWYIKETLASNTGNVERFFACSLDHVEFRSLLAIQQPAKREKKPIPKPFEPRCIECGAIAHWGVDVFGRDVNAGRWYCEAHKT